MSIATITAKDLNDFCSKDLSQPLSLRNNNADEITNVLKVEHRVVSVIDVAGIIRESNNYVVVVDGARKMTDEEHEAFRRMLLDTRWRKAVIFCGVALWDQQLSNRCIHAHVETIPPLDYASRIEYGGSWNSDDIGPDMARVYVTVPEGLDQKVLFQDVVPRASAYSAIDAFVRSQGWLTHSEWVAKYPLRYKSVIDEDRSRGETHCDQVYIDRLTGNTVIRYDLGDPANTNPYYGGISDQERFERKGLKQYERVCVDDCVVKD